MKVTIELKSGHKHNDYVTKSDIQKDIDALNRYLDNKQYASDFISLSDTKSILEAIKNKLPDH